MDFHKLISRYKQFGGIRLVRQYAKLGVLPIVARGFVRCVVKRQSFKAIYHDVLSKVEPFLVQKYSSMVLCKQTERIRAQEFNGSKSLSLEHEHPKVIWWCWLQGKEQAPPVVQACYNSLKRSLPEYAIRVIDAENWKEYVELPDYIIKKWEKKQIPLALFSDLLRLQLLIKYGGTWIDSTVLCTGFNGSTGQEIKKYLDAELFLFQYTPKGTINDISISNWFISAYSNNEVLMVLREMLLTYWKDYNCTLDYYIFHLFFAMVAKAYPEQIASMPYGNSMWSITLMHRLGDTFNKEQWDKLVSKVCFHKLAFRLSDSIKSNEDNYYNFVLKSQSF